MMAIGVSYLRELARGEGKGIAANRTFMRVCGHTSMQFSLIIMRFWACRNIVHAHARTPSMQISRTIMRIWACLQVC